MPISYQERQEESLKKLIAIFESEKVDKSGTLQKNDVIEEVLSTMEISYEPENEVSVQNMSRTSVEHALTHINPEFRIILEFGVWKGDSLRLIRELMHPRFHVCGFDSFQGLPEDWENTPCKKGHFSTKGEIPTIEHVTFYEGWFEDTIPKYIIDIEKNSEIKDKTIGLLHIDCDLYSSTKTIFEYLHPYIKRGTIIVFDDWFYHGEEISLYVNKKYADGEQKAFYEYVIEHCIEWEYIPFVDHQNLYERKIVRIL